MPLNMVLLYCKFVVIQRVFSRRLPVPDAREPYHNPVCFVKIKVKWLQWLSHPRWAVERVQNLCCECQWPNETGQCTRQLEFTRA